MTHTPRATSLFSIYIITGRCIYKINARVDLINQWFAVAIRAVGVLHRGIGGLEAMLVLLVFDFLAVAFTALEEIQDITWGIPRYIEIESVALTTADGHIVLAVLAAAAANQTHGIAILLETQSGALGDGLTQFVVLAFELAGTITASHHVDLAVLAAAIDLHGGEIKSQELHEVHALVISDVDGDKILPTHHKVGTLLKYIGDLRYHHRHLAVH